MSQEPVAIVGMGVFLPGASTVDQYWRNLVDGADAVTEVPPHRRDPGFHGRDGSAPDRTHGRRGGFTPDTLDFDPVAHGVPPTSLEGTEPDQLTALAVAVGAVGDAGGLGRLGDPERIGVVLGRGGYLSPGLRGFDQRVRTVRQITRTVGELMPSAGPDVLERLRTALLEPLGEFRPETAAGLVPNLAAARVANRLDLGGPAYTVDAACASSLVAVDQAIGELTRGRCDAVLAGGAHQTQDDTLWSLFTQLGALSPSQRISPLSRDADGMLIGEGTAIVVLKRLADARRDGDRVYAVIRGSGTSSDGRGASLLSPSVAGQTLALRRAWAGRDPAEIGLLEAHGTATPAGDAAELTTVADVFGQASGPRAVIGSVKSMIGHTLPTAGVAGLVKVALALHHQVLPPTLNCADPNPLLDKTRFRVLAEAEPWGDLPRVAAVNAFGFGGVNAHVVLEAGDPAPKRRVRVDEPERVLRLAAATPEALLERLDQPGDGDGPCRLGIVGPDQRELATARRVLAKVAADGRSWHGGGDIWCSVDPLLPGGKTAFLYPGLEADAEPRLEDVARHFGLDRPQWSTATVPARATSVSSAGLLLDHALRRLGIRPDALAGHSAGEWTAMQAAGMYRAEPDLLERYWPGGFELPEADYLVLGCPAAQVTELLTGDVVISHENAARQTIVCGPPAAVAEFAVTCRRLGIVARTLPFRSGFHTRLMEPHLAPFARLVADLDLLAPAVPVWSATTTRPYPAAAADVRRLYLDHLLRPVRFRQLTEALHDAGFRAFVQVGAGQLGSFVTDTLGERRHLVVAAASGTRPGLAQLRRVATALWTEGGDPDFAALEPRRIRLDTGKPLLSLGEPARGLLDGAAPPELPAGVPAAIVAEFTALLTETRQAAADVVAAARRRVESTVEFSLAAMPYLRDHRFFRQRDGWPDEADFRPVVPATTLVDLACRAAERAWPGTTAVAVRDAVFSRWLIASPAQRVPLSMKREDDRVTVEIGPYALMTVELGAFGPAPSPGEVPGPETAPPLTAAEVYARREMFHGPAYQGLARLTGLGEQHIRGELVVPAAPGGLLDNVGQLLGCWLMATRSDDLLAFPRSIGRLTWYGPEPAPGTRVTCQVRVRLPRPDVLEMDAELVRDGRVLARVEGWRDVRFPCDRAAHRVYAFPAEHLLGERRDDGSIAVTDRWPTVAARDIYAGIYLSASERAEFAAVPPRQQRGWLLTRIAVKDAVRDRLGEPVYPAEIRVHDDGTVSGRHRDLPRFAVTVELRGDTAIAHHRSTP
ncbi:beta-ketoacyl synthase N-terminal-like domain-containing protein [Amycolatopsis sp. DG1A-15b]|uniref:beta-ketoacyl synthase N-terminal-like domain-containing protein n=1 Tax=Amycolatopsis sp. DG1A-15b TaxID=3052846 RepID=UPI00255BFEC3|nr:beta-ketoacyl synthase N-terminal-like domain-containing protein [Amycolatopsis sp. DG1A-15b]WIX85023.1 beta-ketoacyl synthase N-terminal-like domain-containing protein [Amycolatopsis sp. DG1A-15b]